MCLLLFKEEGSSPVSAITERRDMGLYEVPLSMSLLGFGMGTILANFHMCGIMLVLRAVFNMLVRNASPRGPMCFRCLVSCYFYFVLLPLGPEFFFTSILLSTSLFPPYGLVEYYFLHASWRLSDSSDRPLMNCSLYLLGICFLNITYISSMKLLIICILGDE